MTSQPAPDVDEKDLIAARTSLHGLAEQVLAAANRRATGSIRLFIRDGGVATPDLPGPVARLTLRTSGIGRAEVQRAPDGLTVPFAGPLGDLAAALGIEFGLPDPPYRPASGCGPDHVVDVDPAALDLLVGALRLGDAALRRFADPTPVVWPEHLDVAIVLDEVNYGVSPGDSYSAWPYAYVGPHVPRTGEFWNAPFGAARRLSELPGEDDLLAFFREGRSAR